MQAEKMTEGKIIFAFSFRASESPCHPHQFAAGYTVAKNQMSFTHLFFFATFLLRRLCACDQDSPNYGRSSQGGAYVGRLLAIPSLLSVVPYSPVTRTRPE